MSHDERKTCERKDCQRPARMAIQTRRPQRDNVLFTVWTDDRVPAIPLKANRHCYEHGLELVQELYATLVDVDDDPTPEPEPDSVTPGISLSPMVADYRAKPCPSCLAPAGRPCSAPTSTGRVDVAWVHYAREKA